MKIKTAAIIIAGFIAAITFHFTAIAANDTPPTTQASTYPAEAATVKDYFNLSGAAVVNTVPPMNSASAATQRHLVHTQIQKDLL